MSCLGSEDENVWNVGSIGVAKKTGHTSERIGERFMFVFMFMFVVEEGTFHFILS